MVMVIARWPGYAMPVEATVRVKAQWEWYQDSSRGDGENQYTGHGVGNTVIVVEATVRTSAVWVLR